MATFCASFGKKLATFYSNIWPCWLQVIQKIHRSFQVFFVVVVIDLIRCRSVLIRESSDSKEQEILFSSAIVNLVLIAVYLLSLLPSADDSQSNYEELLTNETANERQPLTGTPPRRINRHSYGGFHEPVDPDYLVN